MIYPIARSLKNSRNKQKPNQRPSIKPLVLAFSLLTMPLTTFATSLAIGDKAPSFRAVTIAGKAVNLTDFVNAKPVYLKFWATWCSYCKVEMPHLQAVYDENKSKIEVLTINVGMNDSISNIERFFKGQGFNLPTIFDQKGAITSSYGVVGTPYHVLIDKQGNIVYQTFLATDQLDKKIAEFSLATDNSIVDKPAVIAGVAQ